MLSLQAAKKGWEVAVFFTFYGLNIIHKKKSRRLSPIGGRTPAKGHQRRRETLSLRLFDRCVRICGGGFRPGQQRLGSLDVLEFAKDADVTLFV